MKGERHDVRGNGAFAIPLSLLVAVLLPGTLRGQAAPPTPLVTLLPASVRFAGLAGASSAIGGDAGSVFGNPAGLATIRNIAVEAAFARYPDATLEAMGAGALRLFQFDLGAGYHYLQYGGAGPIRSNLRWSGAAVYRFGLIALGAQSGYVSLEDSSGAIRRAITAGGGLQIAVFDIMALTLNVQNGGRWEVSGGPLHLPTTTHLGFMFNFVDPQSNARLLGTIESVWTAGEGNRMIGGIEGGVVLRGVGLVGRVGLGKPPVGAIQDKFAFGAGLVISRLRVDYAHQHLSALGSGVHRLGVRFTL